MPGNTQPSKLTIVRGGQGRRHALAVMCGAILAIAVACAGSSPVAAQGAEGPRRLAPDAEALLRRTSDVLASARSLTLGLAVLREVRLADGRIASLASSTAIAMRRPNELRAEMRGDATIADIIYDGRRVVVHSIPQGAFAQQPAPPSIDELFPVLQDQLGLPVDIGDLLASEPYAKLTADTVGDIVSPTDINGIPAWHLVLQSGDVGWEFWVRQDETSLPIMASVVRNGLRTLYRFDDWRIDPALNASLFRFTPPPGAFQVPFVFRKESQ